MTDNNGNGKSPWGKKPDKSRPSANENEGSRDSKSQKPGPGASSDDPFADFDAFFKSKMQKMMNSKNGSGKGGNRRPGGSGFGGLPPTSLLWVVFLAAVVLWGLTGFYQVQPQEEGLILRFGKHVGNTGPGLHYHLPYPVEEVIIPNVLRENRFEVGFRDGGDGVQKKVSFSSSGTKPGIVAPTVASESLMLTGDENIVDVNFTVTWKVKDAKEFLFNLRDPAGTVRMAAESAMREIIGQTPIMDVIADGRSVVQVKAHVLLQKLLDEYGAGIMVTALQLQDAKAPAQVNDAFYEVQRARADKERFKNEAEAYKNDILPKAEGEAQQIMKESEAYKRQVIDAAIGESARFTSVLSEYQKAREVTARRLYLETMEDVMQKSNKVIIDSKARGVVPYLPLNDLNARPAKQ